MAGTPDNDGDEWEAELFAVQMQEWMKSCPEKERCPGARIFNHIQALHEKVKRLEHEVNRIKEFPDEE